MDFLQTDFSTPASTLDLECSTYSFSILWSSRPSLNHIFQETSHPVYVFISPTRL